MDRKPTLYIGNKPFYIGYVGVDEKTKEVVTEVTTLPDKSKELERTASFAKPFGYYLKKENESTA